MSKKRSFEEVCVDNCQTNAVNTQRRMNHDEQVLGVYHAYSSQTVYNDSFGTYERVISPSIRAVGDPFVEALDEQRIYSMGRNFQEYRPTRSLSSEGTSSCSCSSTATIINDLMNFEQHDIAFASQLSSTDYQPLPFAVADTVNMVDREWMELENPLTTPMFPTNTHNESKTDVAAVDVVRGDATSGSILDTKSDEETFDLLLQLYESWK
jgi:hypothetical protein